jgi:parallel beta-helix repeat protein
MIYRVLLAVGAFVLAITSTLVLGNGGPTYVDTCGVTSSSEGEVILVSNDVVDTSIILWPQRPTNCIFITHDDVTLDCQGYRLTHSGNGRTRGVLVDSNRVTVQNCELYGAWLNGIVYINGDDGVVLHNKLVGNRWGIGLLLSEGSWVEGNKVDAAANAGIQVAEATSSMIYKNTIHGSGSAGILLNGPRGEGGADGNFVIHNQVNLNVGDGILLQDDSQNNMIFGNTANLNSGFGIALFDSSEGNEIEKNTANRNNIGIYSEGSNSFNKNRCHKNTTADSAPGDLCK